MLMNSSLMAEAEQLLIATHQQLLHSFARSERNGLYADIRLFRDTLRKIADWAEKRGCEHLADLAHWHERYWFRQEYGDSHFNPISSGSQDQPITSITLTNACAKLVTYTLEKESLTRDFADAMTSSVSVSSD